MTLPRNLRTQPPAPLLAERFPLTSCDRCGLRTTELHASPTVVRSGPAPRLGALCGRCKAGRRSLDAESASYDAADLLSAIATPSRDGTPPRFPEPVPRPVHSPTAVDVLRQKARRMAEDLDACARALGHPDCPAAEREECERIIEATWDAYQRVRGLGDGTARQTLNDAIEDAAEASAAQGPAMRAYLSRRAPAAAEAIARRLREDHPDHAATLETDRHHHDAVDEAIAAVGLNKGGRPKGGGSRGVKRRPKHEALQELHRMAGLPKIAPESVARAARRQRAKPPRGTGS